jgi:hypothetical protein
VEVGYHVCVERAVMVSLTGPLCGCAYAGSGAGSAPFVANLIVCSSICVWSVLSDRCGIFSLSSEGSLRSSHETTFISFGGF